MRDLELYRLTPLFWFDDSLSNRKKLDYRVTGHHLQHFFEWNADDADWTDGRGFI